MSTLHFKLSCRKNADTITSPKSSDRNRLKGHQSYATMSQMHHYWHHKLNDP